MAQHARFLVVIKAALYRTLLSQQTHIITVLQSDCTLGTVVLPKGKTCTVNTFLLDVFRYCFYCRLYRQLLSSFPQIPCGIVACDSVCVFIIDRLNLYLAIYSCNLQLVGILFLSLEFIQLSSYKVCYILWMYDDFVICCRCRYLCLSEGGLDALLVSKTKMRHKDINNTKMNRRKAQWMRYSHLVGI